MKLIYATIAAFIVMFAIDFLWYGIIFKAYLSEHMPGSENGSIAFHALGDLCFVLLIAFIYPMGYKGGTAMKEGAKFGLLMGLVAEVPTALHMHAEHTWSLHLGAFFVLSTAVISMIGGIVIAMVYGKKTVPQQT